MSVGTVAIAVQENRLKEHLAGLFPEEERPVEGANAPEKDIGLGPTSYEEGQALAQANARQHRWIEEVGRQQRNIVR